MPLSLSLRCALSICFLAYFVACAAPQKSPERVFDVVIYGGTSAGVMAAVQAAEMGKTAVIVCPEQRMGGLSSSGLGWTDSGDKAVIGGLSKRFYQRVQEHYNYRSAWRQQQPEQLSRYRPEADAMWVFEPHVAESIFEDLLSEYSILVHRNQWLDRAAGVSKQGTAITSITTTSGQKYSGRMFIDATYEGDLMAATGVSYTVGRESNKAYGETLNGVQIKNATHHQFKNRISPYVTPDNPSSGVLPGISVEPHGNEGEGDHRIQAYCFRVCLTDDPNNQLPFEKPAGYDPLQYELLLRDLLASPRHVFATFDPMPNRKTDTNNNGSFSTDKVGGNYEYPEASYERRAALVEEHKRYQMGLFWFLQTDPRVPKDVRTKMRNWGLAADEFTESGGWPNQIYVREARRMVGEFVMTERSLRGLSLTPESVGMGSYNMDSHNVQRYVATDESGHAFVQNDGDVQVSPGRSYEIARGALLPKESECSNLIVPVAVSASHIAYGSIRMEPVFMILGQSAATMACLAIDGHTSVQGVEWKELRTRLLADGQVLQ